MERLRKMKFALYSVGLWWIGIATGLSVIYLRDNLFLLVVSMLGWTLVVILFAASYLKLENQ
jgi:hypothetical protein